MSNELEIIPRDALDRLCDGEWHLFWAEWKDGKLCHYQVLDSPAPTKYDPFHNGILDEVKVYDMVLGVKDIVEKSNRT